MEVSQAALFKNGKIKTITENKKAEKKLKQKATQRTGMWEVPITWPTGGIYLIFTFVVPCVHLFVHFLPVSENDRDARSPARPPAPAGGRPWERRKIRVTWPPPGFQLFRTFVLAFC